MKTSNFTKLNVFSFLAGLVVLFLAGCTNSEKKATDQEEIVAVEEVEPVAAVETDVWVIDEHQINDIPLTTKANTTKKLPARPKKVNAEVKKTNEAVEAKISQDAVNEDAYEIATNNDLNILMQDVAYVPVTITESAVPLDDTQSLVAYSKKGNAEDMVQVISSGPDNEVEQVIFTNKKHKDVYNVQAGMSGKEVKKLRKDMKHLEKDGKTYLYNDDSNIMYLMEAQDMAGNTVTDADIDNMSVSAIIWKDKKHHKK
jgi:hypothetical protein